MLIHFDTPDGPVEQEISGKPLEHILDLVSHQVEGIKIVPSNGPATQRLGTPQSKTSKTD